MAGTNDMALNVFWVGHDQVVNNVISMCTLAQAYGIIPIISFNPFFYIVYSFDLQSSSLIYCSI